MCFNDPGASTSSGTQLNLYRCYGYASSGTRQRWVFIQPEDSNSDPVYDEGHPVYEIYNVAAGLCLSAANLLAGMPVTLGTCNRYITRSQIWWELLYAGTSPDGPTFQIFPWPLEYTYGNCVSASNLSRQQQHSPGPGALRPHQRRPALEPRLAPARPEGSARDRGAVRRGRGSARRTPARPGTRRRT